MDKKNEIKVFEDKQVRTIWDAEQEKWYISIIDVISVLTEQSSYQGARNYWKVLKHRLLKEGNETVTNCNQLKMEAPDGKMRLTDVADTEQLFRLIQSIPSPKAEPFKLWLAQVASERLDEMQDPELSIDRALQQYLNLGYSENWINQRLKSIEVRKELTNEWKKRGLKEGVHFATLTDIITKAWSDKTTKEYKILKGLKKENLRDKHDQHRIDIKYVGRSIRQRHFGSGKSKNITVARKARLELEARTGKKVVSSLNIKTR
jgi:hypothetical protein